MNKDVTKARRRRAGACMWPLAALLALSLAGQGLAGCGDSETPAAAPEADAGSGVNLDALGGEKDTGAQDAGASNTDLGASDAAKSADDGQAADTAAADASLADTNEPTDIGEPTDTEAPTDAPDDTGEEADAGAVDNGQVDPGGFLDKDAGSGCDALDLPEAWAGTFDGDIMSNFGDVGVEGTMSFDIKCIGSKLVVSGKMEGFGEGQPFNVELQGFYNPGEQTLKAKLSSGSVALFWVIPVAFEGDLEGSYDGTAFVGEWSGENTDKTVLQATGEGTWTATGS